MIAAAAILTFLLLAGAGIVWAVRRDETRRTSGKWTSVNAGEGGFTGYGAGTTETTGWEAGGLADCGGGGAGDSADCGGGGGSD